MKFWVYSLLALTVFIFAPYAPTDAHTDKACDGHHCSHTHQEVSEAELRQLTPEEVSRLEAGRLHHQLEAASDGHQGWRARFVEWRRGFNPLLFRSNLVRTFRGSRGASYQEAMADIVFIFSISHPLEMTAGALAASTGVSMDWPVWLTSLTTAGGILISIPGFDPGCILLIGGYAAVKPKLLAQILTPYRWLIRGGRKFVVHEIKHASQMLGIPQAGRLIFERRPGLEVALEKFARESELGSFQRFHEADSAFTHQERMSLMTYDFREKSEVVALEWEIVQEKENEDPYLSEITFDLKSGISPTEWAQRMKPLGWNVRSLVKEVARLYSKGKLSALESRFYTREVVQDEETLTVRLKPKMIHIPKVTRVRSLREMWNLGCAAFLKAV